MSKFFAWYHLIPALFLPDKLPPGCKLRYKFPFVQQFRLKHIHTSFTGKDQAPTKLSNEYVRVLIYDVVIFLLPTGTQTNPTIC